jgi:hypothetical protein
MIRGMILKVGGMTTNQQDMTDRLPNSGNRFRAFGSDPTREVKLRSVPAMMKSCSKIGASSRMQP